ncbi:MAG TPA: hypothetical protein VGD60_16020 [Candidatus Acidoferrales bacterium]
MADTTLFKRLYQILTWSSFAVLVVVIILVLRKSPAPDVTADPAAAQRAEKKFEAADQAKAAGQPSQVALDRTELNSYLAQNLGLAGAAGASGATAPVGSAGIPAGGSGGAAPGASGNDPTAVLSSNEQPTIDQVQSSVKDVKVDMDGDVVKAFVIFDFHGKDMTLELDGHLSGENGYMQFDPIGGKLGSLPLPQSVLNEAVDKLMSSPENREKLKLPDDINSIQIVNGQAVVQYK